LSAANGQVPSCPLCSGDGGRVVWRNALLRVVHAQEAGFPAFYRVIANRHITEWTDLPASERAAFMQVVEALEQALRQTLKPTKINIASLGNAVPHLHWHVVARFDWDSHFPASVWATPLRERHAANEAALVQKLAVCEQAMIGLLGLSGVVKQFCP
jgi:diadenosine tetraphosphate (Ap4A) HIT family hydrolase